MVFLILGTLALVFLLVFPALVLSGRVSRLEEAQLDLGEPPYESLTQ